MGDVLDKINTASVGTDGKQQIIATLDPDGHSIQLADTQSGTITVAALNSSNAARDLGLTKPTSSPGYFKGDRINAGVNSPLLRELNSGKGVNLGVISIQNRNNVTSSVDLTGAKTVADLLDRINATATGVTASLDSNGTKIVLTDTTGQTTAHLAVSDTSGTTAADLGLQQNVLGSSITSNDTALRALGSGTLTFQFGKGAVNDVVKLTDLNGGKGVSRGSIKISDASGASGTVDLSKAVDIQDVVDAINNQSSIDVVASIGGTHGDQLVLNDRSGGTGAFSVKNVGNATTATDLGIAKSVTGSSTITGDDINKLNNSSSLNLLNDGLGVRVAGAVGAAVADFSVNYKDVAGGGATTAYNVDLSSAKTMGDVLTAINTAGKPGATQLFTASLASDGHSIQIQSNTGGNTVALTALHGSNALRDLGLAGTTEAESITGGRLNQGLNSAQLSELNGGAGVRLGVIQVKSRTAGSATSVDLSGAQTFQDVINTINGTSGLGVTAAINSTGNGIILNDTTGATTGTMSVSGNAAVDLGIAQSVSSSTIRSGDRHLRALSDNTLLSSLNGGAGFTAGQMRLTDAKGVGFVVDLSSTSLTTVGDVLAKINVNPTGIRASMNAEGNGILLTAAEPSCWPRL